LRGLRPVLALEMFSWDGQAGLNRYLLTREMSREQFLEATHWKENWGSPFEDYEPLIVYARHHTMPVLALNPPRTLVRQIAFQGLDQALADPAMARWGMRGETLADVPAYRQVVLDQLRRCHGGLSDAGYEHMYEASVFRDEGMAKTIADFLRTRASQQGPVVSYTGGGHIQYRVPVPDRVARRQAEELRQVTVYMTALDPGRLDAIQQFLDQHIADYVWLTPVGQDGPPARC
ncbi:MAG: ChaN family lipoprotein, partial [bacterium]